MIQRDIPDGEGFKFGIARGIAPLVLMVELTQTGGQLAAAGAGGRHYHQGAGGFNVLVSSEALVADDPSRVGGVAGDAVVVIHPDSQTLQPGLERLGDGLLRVPGQYHTGNVEPKAAEHIDQPDHVPVIGNAQVTPDLVFLDIVGVDGDDHLHLILQLQQHSQLAVRLKSRKHPGGMVVVIELAAELQIQLAAENGNPLPDMLRLHPKILLVVKSLLHHSLQPLFKNYCPPLYRIPPKKAI